MEENYKPNSYNYKREQEQKKVEKIITGEVKSKKKSVVHKLTGNVIKNDMKDILPGILMDGASNGSVLIANILKGIIDGIFTGDYRGSSSSYRDYSRNQGPYYRYDKSYDKKPIGGDINRRTYRNFDYDCEDIYLDSPKDADRVLESLNEILNDWNIVTVGDFYQRIGKKTDPIDFKYGWDDLSTAGWKSTSNGYLIVLPRIKPIN